MMAISPRGIMATAYGDGDAGDALDSGQHQIGQIREALTIALEEFGRVPDRADAHQIKRAERHRGDREDDTNAFGAA